MRVALFASAFHPCVGGVEEVVRQLAHGLKRCGHSAIVITNCWPRDLAPKELFEEITVYRLPLRTPDVNLKSRLTYFLSHRKVEREIEEILRRESIDLLHVHCVSANALYALKVQKSLKLPLVVTSHSERTMDATRIFERSAFMNNVLRRSLSEADVITACSRDTLDDLIQFMGDAMTLRHVVVYNGIDAQEFTKGRVFSHPKPYILALGRFVQQKGFDFLLEAFAKANVGKTHDLILAGDGPELGDLEKRIQQLGLSFTVHLPGRTDRGQTLAMMANASFFVLSSRHEGFPMVCLEAMASGKAILATAVGGVPESVRDGVTGLLVPKENPDAMAAGMTKLAADAALREQFGRAGRERAKELSWDAIVQEYLEVYHQAQRS